MIFGIGMVSLGGNQNRLCELTVDVVREVGNELVQSSTSCSHLEDYFQKSLAFISLFIYIRVGTLGRQTQKN